MDETRRDEIIKYTKHLIPGYTMSKLAERSLRWGLVGAYIDIAKLAVYMGVAENILK